MSDATAQGNGLVQYMDAKDVCCGCRCGYLGCDCMYGCMACKMRARHCFCWSIAHLTNFCCNVCAIYYPDCRCMSKHSCKYCVVSLMKCKRGGCLRYLPNILSEEAKPYIALFQVEDGPDDDEPIPAGKDGDTDSVISFMEVLAIKNEIPAEQPITQDSLEGKSLTSEERESDSADSGNITASSSSDESTSP